MTGSSHSPSTKIPASPKPEKRRRADWEAVERDYRTGKFTLRELEAQHGVSAGQISKKARELEWTKDLRAVIKQATDHALLLQNATQTQQATQQGNAPAGLVTAVLVTAEMNKQVILGHRQDITRLRGVTMKAVERLVKDADTLDAADKPADPAVILLSAQRATQSLARLQEMERRAFSLDDDEDPASKDQVGPVLTDAQRASRLALLLSKARAQQDASNAE